jgi:hypothetical protein
MAADWLPDPLGENGPGDLCSFSLAGNGLDDTGLSISSGECSLDVLRVEEEGSMGVSSSYPTESLCLFSSSSIAGDKREKLGCCCSTTLSSSGLEKDLALRVCSGEKGSVGPIGVSNVYILRGWLSLKWRVIMGGIVFGIIWRKWGCIYLSSPDAILWELHAGAFVHADVGRLRSI